jgi:hypothetical protein
MPHVVAVDKDAAGRSDKLAFAIVVAAIDLGITATVTDAAARPSETKVI